MSTNRIEFEHNDTVNLQQQQDGNYETDYSNMEELDEESISWYKLITRAVCIILLVLIIIAVTYGATDNPRIFLLAAVFAVFLLVTFMCSFMDIDVLTHRQIWRGRFVSHNDNNGAQGGAEPHSLAATSVNPLAYIRRGMGVGSTSGTGESNLSGPTVVTSTGGSNIRRNNVPGGRANVSDGYDGGL